jgi:phosphoglycolate phosphatase
MIKLVIFDLDGTLVDSSVDLTNALNHAIEPYDLEKLTVQKTMTLVGEGITRLIEKMLGPQRAGIMKSVLERFLDYYSAHLVDFTRPYPGVRETLSELRQYRKCVISNKREALSRSVLSELGLLSFFPVVLGSDSAQETKPSPVPLLKVMEIMSCRPEETVMVGDSNFDIEAGKAAGVHTIAVSYGFRDAGLLLDADFIIDKCQDLISVLEGLNVRINNT